MIAKAKHLFHELHSWPVSVTWPDGYEEQDGLVDLTYILWDGHTEKVFLDFCQRKACCVRYFGIAAFHFHICIYREERFLSFSFSHCDGETRSRGRLLDLKVNVER